MTTERWDPDTFDREVRAERAAARRAVVSAKALDATSDRGKCSDQEVQRREVADKAIKRALAKEAEQDTKQVKEG